ncbi:cystatin-related protein 2-like [Mastomys coucha]|uniref:cystatin-related protein 2-like n=1 Tax=Mastomys coucha TaxID=35658 RepID=UPI0012617344|nr:cystatin-related protein 2-like [Mastomys coucha]
MAKTLWSTFLLAIFVLLLNSSHEAKKFLGTILIQEQSQEALDTFKTVYNVFNNDTYISNIKNIKVWTWSGMIYGKVELGQTTCTRIESDVEKCPLKTEFRPTNGAQGVTRYVITKPVQNTCSEFLSQVADCPFNEQADQQKKVLCNFVTTNLTTQLYKIVMNIKCLNV